MKYKKPTGQGAATPETASQMVNVVPAQTKESATQSVSQQKEEPVKGNKYERMVSKINKEKADEEEARRIRVEKAVQRNAKTLSEAKAKREELNRILNEDYPEMDIDKFIEENAIGVWDAMPIRREYANDQRTRKAILQEIERLNRIINNR